jgi:hypothetical protein
MSQGFVNQQFASGYTYTGTGTIICLQQSPTINQPNLVGTTTNNDAAAGSVGEYKESIILFASSVAIAASGNIVDVTSLSLEAGDWNVWGNTGFNNTTNQMGLSLGWTSTTSATQPNYALMTGFYNTAQGDTDFSTSVPMKRYSLSATTTIYLSGTANFAGGVTKVCGGIFARRVR